MSSGSDVKRTAERQPHGWKTYLEMVQQDEIGSKLAICSQILDPTSVHAKLPKIDTQILIVL